MFIAGNSMRRFSRCVVLALMAAFLGNPALAQDDSKKPVPLDAEQKALCEQVIDRIVADLTAMKAQYPELEHFGEKPWFAREPGLFRYDYKMETSSTLAGSAQPGGCGMYLAFTPTGAPKSKLETSYRGASSGFQRGEVSADYTVASGDGMPGGTEDKIMEVIRNELSGSFEASLCDHALRKRGIRETDAIMDLLANREWQTRHMASRVLPMRTLTGKQLEKLKSGYIQGKYPVDTDDFGLIMQLLKKQDWGKFPDFCMEMTKASLRMEKEGADVLERTPIFNMPWVNATQAVRMGVIFYGQGDERIIPAAELILESDTVLANRLAGLDYMAKLPEEKRNPRIAAALENSFLGVQAKAAEICGTQRVSGVEKPLEALLLSPNTKVRLAAREAVTKLGLQGVEMNPVRPLPAAVGRIADALWSAGLTEKDVIDVCAKPEVQNFDPILPQPVALPIPEGVELVENTAPDKNGKPVKTGDYTLTLTDSWRMSAMDAASVKKRAAQFIVGIREEYNWHYIERTGPFLIAAAVKSGDPQTAQAVYEALCDNFQTDDEIIYQGVQGIAFNRIEAVFDLFQKQKDDEAWKATAPVLAFAKQTRPHTLLWEYVKQAKAVKADIERRKKEKKPAPLLFSGDPNNLTIRWEGKIPDKSERIKRLIAGLEDEGAASLNPQWDFLGGGPVSNTLAAEGKGAIAPLIECILNDTRLTRNIEEEDHGAPLSRVTTVRSAAVMALQMMKKGEYVNMGDYDALYEGDKETLEKVVKKMKQRLASDDPVKSR